MGIESNFNDTGDKSVIVVLANGAVAEMVIESAHDGFIEGPGTLRGSPTDTSNPVKLRINVSHVVYAIIDGAEQLAREWENWDD